MSASPALPCGGDGVNLNLLRTFVSVVEEGNFSRAANKLHLSQPAVSMQMQALAQELGVELFRRHGHRVDVTEAGGIFYDQAKELLRGWQLTVHQLEGLRERLKGRIELGASTVPADFWLPSRLCEFYRLHPDLELRMTVGASQDVIKDLGAGKLDLAVVGYQPQIEGLHTDVLFRDQLVAVFSPQHGLARKKQLGVEDILAQPILERSSGSATRDVFHQALSKAVGHSKLNVAMELGSSRALLEAAARGLGLAVVSKLAAKDYIEQGRLVWRSIHSIDVERSFWLVQPEKLQSQGLKAFVQFLKRGELID